MKSIHVQGNQFRGGSEVRSIVTRTSFCLLGHYQSGNRNRALRWLDRIKAQGFDGPRLFGENQDWFPGDAFFGTANTPKVTAFGDHSGPFSQLELIDEYEGYVTQLAEDLAERDMIAEFCCVATIKGREEGWTGQGLNKFAQMFRRLFPDPQNTPFLHETINEWDAHSVYSSNPEEIGRMGGRWRRSNADPEKHNYPGSTIGVSAGGQWSPGFNDGQYTHRNIHPPRGNQWWLGNGGKPLAETFSDLKDGRPLYLNETIHYMTTGQWDEWVPKIPKWAGLSTTDHVRLSSYIAEILDQEVSVCMHDFVGMKTDPDEPITPGEEAVAEAIGGTVGPPQPAKIRPVVEMVNRGYSEILGRMADPDGLLNYHDLILGGMSEANFRDVLLRAYLKGDR